MVCLMSLYVCSVSFGTVIVALALWKGRREGGRGECWRVLTCSGAREEDLRGLVRQVKYEVSREASRFRLLTSGREDG